MVDADVACVTCHDLPTCLPVWCRDADCELFLKVVLGELPEETYHDQMEMVYSLGELLVQLELVRQHG